MRQARFAGIDCASEDHAVCVVDELGRIVEGRRYRHDERGIRALCQRLVRLEVRLVAIERPDGLLIERLLDVGLSVIAVHPNQVAAMRPRFRVAGGKSDSFDSFVLAELARTDAHRFRILRPDGDQMKALRAMTRAREELIHSRQALANQLREQLAGVRRSWQENWIEQRSVAERFVDLGGDRVLMLTVEHLRGRDGIEVTQPAGSIVTLRDGKVVCFESYLTRQTSLDAAGIAR